MGHCISKQPGQNGQKAPAIPLPLAIQGLGSSTKTHVFAFGGRQAELSLCDGMAMESVYRELCAKLAIDTSSFDLVGFDLDTYGPVCTAQQCVRVCPHAPKP